ncbi:MAG: hypothetical protein KDK41_10275 [Leptospiraceae bacterium]|nr:hypothetical protein [Leptospiraceae bacterium]
MSGYYENSLIATSLLLQKVKATYWHKWLRKDLEIWNESGSVERHLSAYAGCPGSFDDLVILSINGHKIDSEYEYQVNLVFYWLRILCYFFATTKKKRINFKTLLEEFSVENLVLSKAKKEAELFIGPYKLANFKTEISGERCLDCGYAIIPDNKIDQFILDNIIPSWVLWASVNNRLIDLVNRILQWQRTELDELKQEICDCIRRSSIEIRGSMWSKKCPQCKSKDHAVYRWKLRSSKKSRFFPVKNNIKLNF